MKILISNLGIGGGGAEKVLVDLITFWQKEFATYSANRGDNQPQNNQLSNQRQIINPKTDIDLFLIEKKSKDVYLSFATQNLHKVFTFPHIFGRVRFLNKFWKRRVLNNPKLINLFIKERYDLNIGFLEGISSIYVSQKLGGKKIAYIHTGLSEMRSGKRDEQELKAYLQMDLIIFVSNTAKDSALRLYPELKSKNMRVVYNPVDCENVLLKSKEQISESKSKFVFLQVGRLTHQKGLQTLLEANKILQDSENMDYEIWLVGDGARYKKELDSMIAKQGVGNVKFLGFQSNPYKYISACDCFVLASYFEGCPLVLIEAATLGKTIISSDIASSLELLGANGFENLENPQPCAEFFKSQDARDLANAMKKIYFDSKYAKILGANAKERSKHFSVQKTSQNLKDVLFGLLDA